MGLKDIPPGLHPGNAVIAKLYSVVVDNDNLPELFEAWDQFVDEVFKKDPAEAELWRSLLAEHFEQVGPLITASKPSQAEEKQSFIDRQTFPAILFNSGFRIVAKNQQAHAIWPANLDADITASALPPFKPKRILALRDNVDISDPVLISLDIGNENQCQIVMAVIHPVEFTTGDGVLSETLFILRIAKPSWKEELGRMLSSTYSLTDAEIEITRALYQNQNLHFIAEQRGRSIRTVRTQLSHIFEKTGASSQTELVGMISNLGQILDLGESVISKEPRVIRTPPEKANFQILKCKSKQGHDLSYAVYGSDKGKPILSIQPTAPPEMTRRFREAAFRAGLKFIVPYKPGSGQSSSRNYTYSPGIAAQDIQVILSAEKISDIDIIGLASGGIHALKFADMFPDRVTSVTLCDTGVPLKSRKDFAFMSQVGKRTFLTARYFPSLLLTPHKMVAKEFYKSKSGQERIVEYFFDDGSIDHALVKTDPEYYNITRDIIRYSFEDVKQLVDNVCLWASDWAPLLKSVLSQQTVLFLHGQNNDLFTWEKVNEFAQSHPNACAIPILEQSQLGIFTQPEVLMRALSR
ncbi:MAG: alpha/beta fold hydrolase [Alphaproteobacteria bacterium]